MPPEKPNLASVITRLLADNFNNRRLDGDLMSGGLAQTHHTNSPVAAVMVTEMLKIAA